MNQPLETRFYIGLTQDKHPLSMALGPGSPDQFRYGPNEPIQISSTSWAYPVSEEIAEIWIDMDVDDE
jgi:hypothetical protein